MQKSEKIGELAKALSLAQGEMKAAIMGNTNPFFKSKYADLGAVITAVKSALAAHGLSYSQHVNSVMVGEDIRVVVETILMHESDQFLISELTMPLWEEKGKTLIQGMGSHITYLRRYALAAALGVYSDEDADGNDSKAEKSNEKHSSNKPSKPAEKEENDPIKDIQKLIIDQCKAFGGLKNDKLMVLLKKYTPNGNPMVLRDLDALTKLNEELKVFVNDVEAELPAETTETVPSETKEEPEAEQPEKKAKNKRGEN
jgi:hypothetical protein